VARIVPTLEARYDIKALGDQVYDLAFAFITPLGAQHDHIRHEFICSNGSL
jgi:hypothetical protein